MRDILTRQITYIPGPGKTGQQLQSSSVLRNRKNDPGEKTATSGPRTGIFFFTSFAVVLIKWTNIFRPAYFTPRHWREGVISLSGQRAEWKESIR